MSRFIIAFILILSLGSLGAEDVLRYTSKLLDTFDNFDPATEWVVTGSRRIADEYPRVSYINAWPTALYGYNTENADLRVLGVEAAFEQRGYNYLEILPIERLSDGSYEKRPIDLPGDTIGVSMWVWGSNYDFTLEIHVRDYRGMVHQVPMGRMNYHGWRQLTATIPTSIPRVDPYEFNFARLYLDKIVLWTEPREPVNGFFVYFDDLQALSRTNTRVVDGGELTVPEIRQNRWEEASDQSTGAEDTN